jgi:hypothetical protein
VSPLELVDDRFEQLARELRKARPVASEGLRERVRVLAQDAPVERRRRVHTGIAWGRSAKYAALGFAAVAVAVPLVGAGLKALQGSDSSRPVGSRNASTPLPRTAIQDQNAPGNPLGASTLDQRKAVPGTALGTVVAPNTVRLQQYGASMRLRVDDVDALSNATKRAMSVARQLGGYVAAVAYTTKSGRRGGAELVLRVPISNIQTAIQRFSALGTILGQQVSVLDVQRRSDRQAKAIARLQTRLAQIEALLATSLPPVTRARLEHEATADRFALKTLQRKHRALVRRANFAKVDLNLTLPASKHAAAGRLDRTLGAAGTVLVRELEIMLYALIVVGPLLALGGAAIAVGQASRRRSDRRLLERT